jgi:hypothetical protein
MVRVAIGVIDSLFMQVRAQFSPALARNRHHVCTVTATDR